ncbi:LIM homeobox transcription factor 1-alpha-like, partial [Homarus americanus]
GVEVCEGCGRTIHDRFIMRVIDTSWHEDCLVCCVCRVQLQHSCFARDNKIYCKLDYDRRGEVGRRGREGGEERKKEEGREREDKEVVRRKEEGRKGEKELKHFYWLLVSSISELPECAKWFQLAHVDRLFSVKCAGCGDRLLPHELVMRAQSLVFHLHCFACVVCCQVLQKGDQYVLRGHQLFCRADYEKEMFLLQQHGPQSPLGDDFIVDDGSRPRDGRRGPKRPRTILTSAQRKQFMASFSVSPKPCRKVSLIPHLASPLLPHMTQCPTECRQPVGWGEQEPEGVGVGAFGVVVQHLVWWCSTWCGDAALGVVVQHLVREAGRAKWLGGVIVFGLPHCEVVGEALLSVYLSIYVFFFVSFSFFFVFVSFSFSSVFVFLSYLRISYYSPQTPDNICTAIHHTPVAEFDL